MAFVSSRERHGGSAAPGRTGPASARFLADVRLWANTAGSGSASALTCDVEDYFQVSAFEHLVPKASWDKYACRIPRNVDRTLALLAAGGVKATFFTLGWVVERHPEVVRRIVAEGHEIASHGMRHVRVWAHEPEEFRTDVATAKKLLEDVSGRVVRGYRAASWSIDARVPWAHDILAETGYEYSSSLYPISHDHYGVPDAPPTAFYVGASKLLEIPATAVRFAGRNWPAAGGGYFRLYPLAVSQWLLRRATAGGTPAVFYFHPWELDPEQPRMRGARVRARFRHYVNLRKFASRLEVLLRSFAWDRMDRVFGLSDGRAP